MPNLIGSYASAYVTYNLIVLIGPCNRHPNIQSHKGTKPQSHNDTYAQTTDKWAIFSKKLNKQTIKPTLFHRKIHLVAAPYIATLRSVYA